MMTGRILGARYKVEEKIGDGGMAVVYRGTDTLLGRSVTIKILRENLVGDQDVVRSFRREAHAAASLSHPNIVNVYDVGQEGEIYYIIMEYIDGKSLKELILEEGVISPPRAVSIALQVCEALQHAHSHNIIHRDIKPHNILITKDGRAKVADFGIARAISSTTVTYTQSIVGSVHYFSPEQANGGMAGEKSDIYSLGIVIYEMLTGTVPFSGETPMSVALKHLQEEIPCPREINPDIPPELEEVVMKAVEKSPDERYTSAEELAGNLRELQELPDGGTPGTARRKRRVPARRRRKNGGKISKVWFALGGIFFLAALMVGTWFLFQAIMTVPEVEVPHVEGLTLEQAISKLQELGLTYDVAQAPSRDVAPGYVMSQDPLAGRLVRQERLVKLVYSTGPSYVSVPGVVGKTALEASIALRAADLEMVVEEEYNQEVSSGLVMNQIPGEGARLQKGEPVRVIISKGGQPVNLRNLTGMTLDDAVLWLKNNNLEVGLVSRKHSTEPEGQVIGQSPRSGEALNMGNSVDLVVSDGPDIERLQKYRISIEIPPDRLETGVMVAIVVRDVLGERTEVVEYTGDVMVVEGYEEGLVMVVYEGEELAREAFPQ